MIDFNSRIFLLRRCGRSAGPKVQYYWGSLMQDVGSARPYELAQKAAAIGSPGRSMGGVTTGAGREVSQSGLPLRIVADTPVGPSYTRDRLGQLAGKRLLDVALAVLALILVAPLLLFTAIAIKITSPGPVLFVQDRTGSGGSVFRILKFRTMYADSCDESGVSQVRSGDRRVTPLGQFLRRTSVDELPQIFNILRGDMSFVGPRPHVAGMLAGGIAYEELVPYYALRNEMLPGLTGWAQANGFRGPTEDPVTARSRVDHDLAYIQNFSLRLDLWIILLTLRRELFSGRAF